MRLAVVLTDITKETGRGDLVPLSLGQEVRILEMGIYKSLCRTRDGRTGFVPSGQLKELPSSYTQQQIKSVLGIEGGTSSSEVNKKGTARNFIGRRKEFVRMAKHLWKGSEEGEEKHVELEVSLPTKAKRYEMTIAHTEEGFPTAVVPTKRSKDFSIGFGRMREREDIAPGKHRSRSVDETAQLHIEKEVKETKRRKPGGREPTAAYCTSHSTISSREQHKMSKQAMAVSAGPQVHLKHIASAFVGGTVSPRKAKNASVRMGASRNSTVNAREKRPLASSPQHLELKTKSEGSTDSVDGGEDLASTDTIYMSQQEARQQQQQQIGKEGKTTESPKQTPLKRSNSSKQVQDTDDHWAPASAASAARSSPAPPLHLSLMTPTTNRLTKRPSKRIGKPQVHHPHTISRTRAKRGRANPFSAAEEPAGGIEGIIGTKVVRSVAATPVEPTASIPGELRSEPVDVRHAIQKAETKNSSAGKKQVLRKQYRDVRKRLSDEISSNLEAMRVPVKKVVIVTPESSPASSFRSASDESEEIAQTNQGSEEEGTHREGPKPEEPSGKTRLSPQMALRRDIHAQQMKQMKSLPPIATKYAQRKPKIAPRKDKPQPDQHQQAYHHQQSHHMEDFYDHYYDYHLRSVGTTGDNGSPHHRMQPGSVAQPLVQASISLAATIRDAFSARADLQPEADAHRSLQETRVSDREVTLDTLIANLSRPTRSGALYSSLEGIPTDFLPLPKRLSLIRISDVEEEVEPKTDTHKEKEEEEQVVVSNPRVQKRDAIAASLSMSTGDATADTSASEGGVQQAKNPLPFSSEVSERKAASSKKSAVYLLLQEEVKTYLQHECGMDLGEEISTISVNDYSQRPGARESWRMSIRSLPEADEDYSMCAMEKKSLGDLQAGVGTQVGEKEGKYANADCTRTNEIQQGAGDSTAAHSCESKGAGEQKQTRNPPQDHEESCSNDSDSFLSEEEEAADHHLETLEPGCEQYGLPRVEHKADLQSRDPRDKELASLREYIRLVTGRMHELEEEVQQLRWQLAAQEKPEKRESKVAEETLSFVRVNSGGKTEYLQGTPLEESTPTLEGTIADSCTDTDSGCETSYTEDSTQADLTSSGDDGEVPEIQELPEDTS